MWVSFLTPKIMGSRCLHVEPPTKAASRTDPPPLPEASFEGVFRKRAKEDPKLQEENDNEESRAAGYHGHVQIAAGC